MASGEQYKGRIVVKTDCGVGCRSGVAEEVVFLGVAFYDDGLVENADPSKPYCYHASRDGLLEMANKLRKEGHLNIFGMDGPAVKLVIPGIPFPLGKDFTGDQTQDAGGHLTLYARAGSAANGSPYTPPDLTSAQQMVGRECTFTTLPPQEGLKILVASESNDMKTGVCYYLAVTFDDASTSTANELKSVVGLAADITQRFHLSIAGLAPAWQSVHSKSQRFRAADKEKQKEMQLAEDFQTFRKGSEGFAGFNADAVTNWTTYASQAAAMGKENGRIGKEIAELAKEPESQERDDKMANLTADKKDIIKTLGFPKSVGRNKGDLVSAEALKSAMPDTASQEAVMAAFAAKRVVL